MKSKAQIMAGAGTLGGAFNLETMYGRRNWALATIAFTFGAYKYYQTKKKSKEN